MERFDSVGGTNLITTAAICNLQRTSPPVLFGAQLTATPVDVFTLPLAIGLHMSLISWQLVNACSALSVDLIP